MEDELEEITKAMKALSKRHRELYGEAAKVKQEFDRLKIRADEIRAERYPEDPFFAIISNAPKPQKVDDNQSERKPVTASQANKPTSQQANKPTSQQANNNKHVKPCQDVS